MSLTVISAGPLTLVEDDGRPGLASQGVGPSGAFDRRATHQARALVGDAGRGTAVLEVLGGGLVLRADAAHVVAVTGAVGPVLVDATPVDHGRPLVLRAGQVLELGGVEVGLRAYVAVGGGLAGASGAYLTLSLTPQWAEGMTAGRGWIAVALVIFGAWRPGRAAVGALLFGGLLALKTRLQTFGVDISPILLSMLPYVLTITVLIVISVRARNRPSPSPAALGTAYRREER